MKYRVEFEESDLRAIISAASMWAVVLQNSRNGKVFNDELARGYYEPGPEKIMEAVKRFNVTVLEPV